MRRAKKHLTQSMSLWLVNQEMSGILSPSRFTLKSFADSSLIELHDVITPKSRHLGF